MKIQRVIFDFDNTLFDTETLKGYFWKIAHVHGFSPEEILVLYKHAREKSGHITITIESFLSVVKDELKKRNKPFLDRVVYELIQQMERAEVLVPGAKKLLELCERAKVDRYLLSLGVPEWQEQKVRRSGVEHFFEKNKIFFTTELQEGKEALLARIFTPHFQGEGTAIFNDKPDETAQLLKKFPKLLAFVRQEVRDVRYSEKDFRELEKLFAGRVVCSPLIEKLITLFKILI